MSCPTTSLIEAAVAVANTVDVVILAVGLDGTVEGTPAWMYLYCM